jgi:hypothetical protein
MRAAAGLAIIFLFVGVGCGASSSENRTLPDRLTRIVLEPTSASNASQLDLSVKIMHDRLEKLGVKDASVARDAGRIELILPGTSSARFRC